MRARASGSWRPDRGDADTNGRGGERLARTLQSVYHSAHTPDVLLQKCPSGGRVRTLTPHPCISPPEPNMYTLTSYMYQRRRNVTKCLGLNSGSESGGGGTNISLPPPPTLKSGGRHMPPLPPPPLPTPVLDLTTKCAMPINSVSCDPWREHKECNNLSTIQKDTKESNKCRFARAESGQEKIEAMHGR